MILIEEIGSLIEKRFELERNLEDYECPSLDWETRLAFHVIGWSRYASYWTLYHVAELRYPEESSRGTINSFMQALARMFFTFSIVYGRQIYEVHSFIAEITEMMFEKPSSAESKSKAPLREIMAKVMEKTASRREALENALTGDFASYALPKNLACRVLECLHHKSSQTV